jgi:microcompartment protein CcmK/EutM
MRLARVLGPVWGARRVAGLDGAKLLEVEVLGGGERSTRERIIAVDQLGAGPGERVLVAHGSRVRDLTVGERVADKDIVVAIVDGVEEQP